MANHPEESKKTDGQKNADEKHAKDSAEDKTKKPKQPTSYDGDAA